MDFLEKHSSLIVSYSGGKDSTACLLWALETGKPVRAIFADTGNEPPDTLEYLDYVERTLRISIERYAHPEHDFFEMVRRRGQWPMVMKCEISRANKVDDFRRYLKSTDTPMDALIILGQRHAESARRSTLPAYSDFIDSGRAAYRPIIDWSAQDVFEYIGTRGIRAHPAYGRGRGRVGCVWCVNQKLSDCVLDERLYPERCAKLRELRDSIGLTSIPEGIEQLEMFRPMACLYESVHCE